MVTVFHYPPPQAPPANADVVENPFRRLNVLERSLAAIGTAFWLGMYDYVRHMRLLLTWGMPSTSDFLDALARPHVHSVTLVVPASYFVDLFKRRDWAGELRPHGFSGKELCMNYR